MSIFHLTVYTVSILMFQRIFFFHFLEDADHFLAQNMRSSFINRMILTQVKSIPFCLAAYYSYKFLLAHEAQYFFIIVFSLIALIISEISTILYKRFSFVFMLSYKNYLSFSTTMCLQMGFLSLSIISGDSLHEVLLYNFSVSLIYLLMLYSLVYFKPAIQKNYALKPLLGMPLEFLSVAIVAFSLLGIFN